jgi:hypothetical protein
MRAPRARIREERRALARGAEDCIRSVSLRTAPSRVASSASRRFGSSMRLLSLGVAVQQIEDHGPRVLEDCLRVAHHQEGADLATLPSRAISTARFTTLLSVLLFTPRLSEQTSSSNSASGPVLSAPPLSPSDALGLLAASSTAASSPSRGL